MNGWICLHRKILNWGWFTDANTLMFFLYILLRANYEPKEYLGHIIDRGQVAISRLSVARKLNMTQSQVRTAMSHLKKTGEIDYEGMGKWTLVTIKKYDFYQDIELPNSPDEADCESLLSNINTNRSQTDDKEMTNRPQRDDKQIATNKQYNKYNKLNNITNRAQNVRQTTFANTYSDYDSEEMTDFERAMLVKRLKRTRDM